jgi:hypothetical protein
MFKTIALVAALALAATPASANFDDVLKRIFNGPGPSVDADQWNNHNIEQVPDAQCWFDGAVEWCEDHDPRD